MAGAAPGLLLLVADPAAPVTWVLISLAILLAMLLPAAPPLAPAAVRLETRDEGLKPREERSEEAWAAREERSLVAVPPAEVRPE